MTLPQPLSRPRSPLRPEAAFWAVTLSVAFMLVYGGCLHLAAARDHVPTLYFAWERHVPLVPAMIVPYMSIDLFFVAAPFVCTSRRELRTHAKRVLLAIAVAGVCFAAFPLRMGFERPPIEGVFAPWFALLGGFDKPFNLAPSLHIALRAILWMTYVRHTRGWLRRAVQVWFVLIGASTLLTWQHHAFDWVTGEALGLAAIWLVRERLPRRARWVTPRPALAIRYTLGVAALVGAGWLLRPWGWVLLWPVASLGIVAAAYLGLGPAVFRKSPDGRLDAATRFVLGPYLLGVRLVFPYYRRQAPPWTAVAPGLVIGRRLGRRDARRLVDECGVTAVLDLAPEFTEVEPLRRLRYASLPILDLTVPTPRQQRTAIRYVRRHVGTGGVVYVHCSLGYARAAGIAAAYLLNEHLAADAGAAVARVRAARPQAVIDAASVGAIVPPAPAPNVAPG